jgi:glutamate N-acetyltransferase / amino-acid N-acetyltransferase
MIEQIRGGLTAPLGFRCGTACSGIKNPKATRLDTALIVSDAPCASAATFTSNAVKAAPVRLSMTHLKAGKIQAVVLNSGNANACTGPMGMEIARRMAEAAGDRVGLKARQVLVCSTGRIGIPLPLPRIEKGLKALTLGRTSSRKCARSIMTSDTFPKEISCLVSTANGAFRIGAIAKGAGMIDPNMATMLCVITTDAVVSQPVLRKLLRTAVESSFNRITIDGDMSTNDTVIALANGASGVTPQPEDLLEALDAVTQTLARQIVLDGEGVTKFIAIEVQGARTARDARRAAEAVANSTLVKCAWAGGDPNWGRIMDALGYSGAKLQEDRVQISYENLPLVQDGLAAITPWKKLKSIAARKEFTITIDLALGSGTHTVWTTDLTQEFVRLNLSE